MGTNACCSTSFLKEAVLGKEPPLGKGGDLQSLPDPVSAMPKTVNYHAPVPDQVSSQGHATWNIGVGTKGIIFLDTWVCFV